MKTTITALICLSVILACPCLSAQHTSLPAEQRFKQFDKNGDGKLTRDEVADAAAFAAADAD